MAQFLASDFALLAATVAGLAITTAAILREFPAASRLRTRARPADAATSGRLGA